MADEENNPLVPLFLTGALNHASGVRKLKYIGPLYEKRLKDLNMHTLQDVVEYFANQKLRVISERMTSIFQNVKGNLCVDQAKTRTQYQINDVNMRAYNIIIYLLRYARANPASFGVDEGRVHIGYLPELQGTRDQAAKMCACLGAPECKKKTRDCQWLQPELGTEFGAGRGGGGPNNWGQCVPRPAQGENPFIGRAGYSDQMIFSASGRGRGGAKKTESRGRGNSYGPASYSSLHSSNVRWRRPDKLPAVPLPARFTRSSSQANDTDDEETETESENENGTENDSDTEPENEYKEEKEGKESDTVEFKKGPTTGTMRITRQTTKTRITNAPIVAQKKFHPMILRRKRHK